MPTAIASFAFTPESFEATISNVIFLGGDTDTLAAMAGALAGAYVGAGRLPARLVGLLESRPKKSASIHWEYSLWQSKQARPKWVGPARSTRSWK